MKKYILLFVSIFLLVALAACGGNGDDEMEGEAEEVETVGDELDDATDLTFWTFAGTHADFFVNAAERWNEENPDRAIRLTAETFPFDQMHNNALMALQSGTGAPDIIDLEIARFPNFLQGDIQLEPLNDLIEDELDNFITERLDIYGNDGTYYGAPTHLGATVVYYNRDIMDEAGVDIDAIETWDDYVEAGKVVVEETGTPMTNIHTGWYGIWPFITQRGSDFFDEDGELILDNETNIETLQYVADMIHVEEIATVSPGGGDFHSEEYYGYMNDEGAASVIMPLFYMKDFVEYMPDLAGKMEIRPMPTWPDSDLRTVGMGGTGTAVTSQSDHVDLAKDFLYFAKLSEEGNLNLWTELGFDPPRWDVWDEPEMHGDNEYSEFFHDGIFDMLLDIRDEVASVEITENIPNVLDEIDTTVMHNVVYEGNQTAEEALTEAAQTVRSLIESRN